MTGVKLTTNPLFLRDEDLRQGIELLYFAYQDFIRDADKILAEYGFGRAHHRAIHFVNSNPGITVSELLSILKVTKQSLSRVLGQLVRDGFIVQLKSEGDRRQRLLKLTPRGVELERRLSEIQRRKIAQAYREAGAEAVEGYCQVLSGMIGEEDRHRVLGRRHQSGGGE